MGKNIIVTGATGLIGKILCRRLSEKGYLITVLSRNPEKAQNALPGMVAYLEWKPGETGQWENRIDGAYAVIHLAGAPMFDRRWGKAQYNRTSGSRSLGTKSLVDAMSKASVKPYVFICASAIGIYGLQDISDERVTEDTPFDYDYWTYHALDWELEADKAIDLAIRTVKIRSGIVLDFEEGGLSRILKPFRYGLGGTTTPVNSWFPWIHIEDEVGLFIYALENAYVSGAINGTAPCPVTKREFSYAAGRLLRRPSFWIIPAFLLWLPFGKSYKVITKGKRIIPQKAMGYGYQFKYPDIAHALENLLLSKVLV